MSALHSQLHRPLIAVVGPTASGKTAVSQLIAEQLGASVLSADSMQIYRGMNIGTGKIAPEARTVPYYGLDLIEPGQAYSAALFQSYGRDVAITLDDQDSRCVLCGGTGLYIQAVIDDYSFAAGDLIDNPSRRQWTRFAEEQGVTALWNELQQRDPSSAELIHPNNVRRVIRALELFDEGTSYSERSAPANRIPAFFPTTLIGLLVDTEVLNARINARVDRMFEEGLVDEVETLLDRGLHDALTAKQAIGYKEVVAALEGQCSLQQASDDIKQATRRYAKRQRTWFRKDDRITWIRADSTDASSLAEEALEHLSIMDERYFEQGAEG